tara:strand:+ start:889 stop:1296 length:408 start_codon:yes stop_codon:yes gene_type:complete
MNRFDSDIEDDEYYLDDNDPDFIDFKEDVKLWLKLDDDIKTLNEAIKERKTKKNEITPRLLDFMEKHEINDLNTNEGHLKFQKSLRSKPLSKKYLMDRLGFYFKNNSKSEKIVNFLYNNREKTETTNLKRIHPKK